ncbi:MAG: DUF3016 domain-containing protein [Dokdonella sp.]
MSRSKNRIGSVWLAGAMLALAAVSASATPEPAGQASRVEVNWTNPDNFADVREAPGPSIGRTPPQEWLGDLSKHLKRRADRLLAPGQHLDVTFTDVRRAGSYEPWRGPQWDDIRVVTDIYPPMIDLQFKLTDANGTTLREGDRKLRDLSFLNRGTLSQQDPLRFEKRMLDDWLRREFPPAQTRRD